MIFLLVILAVTDKRNEHPSLAPLAIGLTLFYAARRLGRDQPRLARHVVARATPA